MALRYTHGTELVSPSHGLLQTKSQLIVPPATTSLQVFRHIENKQKVVFKPGLIFLFTLGIIRSISKNMLVKSGRSLGAEWICSLLFQPLKMRLSYHISLYRK